MSEFQFLRDPVKPCYQKEESSSSSSGDKFIGTFFIGFFLFMGAGWVFEKIMKKLIAVYNVCHAWVMDVHTWVSHLF